MNRKSLFTLLIVAVNIISLSTPILEVASYKMLSSYASFKHLLSPSSPIPIDIISAHKTPITIFKIELFVVSILLIYFLHRSSRKEIPDSAENKTRTLFAALILLSLLPVWGFQYYPSSDGPVHLLEAHILREFENPGFNYQKYFDVNPYVKTNLLFQMFALTLPWLSIYTIEKLFLTFVFTAIALSLYYFLKSFGDTQGKEFLAFIFIYTMPLSLGFYNYIAGLPLFLLTVGYYYRSKNKLKAKDILVLAVLSLACLFAHASIFIVTISVIGALMFMEAGGRGKVLITVLLLLLIASVISITFPKHYILDSLNPQNLIQSYLSKSSIPNSAYKLIRHLTPTSIIQVMNLLAVSIIIFYGLATKKKRKNNEFLFIAAAGLIIYFLIPTNMLEGHASRRLITPVFFLLLPALKIKKKDRFPLAVLITVLFSFTVLNQMYFHAKYNRDIWFYTSGLDFVEPGSRIFYGASRSRVGTIDITPTYQAWAYYLIGKGGIAPYGFYTPAHSILYTGTITSAGDWRVDFSPGVPPLELRSCLDEQYYDYIIAWDIEYPTFRCGLFKLVFGNDPLRIYARNPRAGAVIN